MRIISGFYKGKKIFEEIFIGNKIQKTDHKDILKANEDFHFLGSPTYQREHHYNLKKLNLVHFDFYQVDGKTHVDLEDYFMNNCLLIEWPLEDLKKRYLPDAMLIKINIKEQKRIIEISSPNPKWLP